MYIIFCRKRNVDDLQGMFAKLNLRTEGLLLTHFFSHKYTELREQINRSQTSSKSRHGDAFTLLDVVRTFAKTKQTSRRWAKVNKVNKCVVEKFFLSITEALLTDHDEDGTGYLTLDAILNELRQDTDIVDNILLQILSSHFHHQVYVRQIYLGRQQFIRLGDGKITYQQAQLDTDCFVDCNKYQSASISSNHQVLVPMEILMNVLRAKDFPNSYLKPHIIECVPRNVIGILLHNEYIYSETLQKQFDIPVLLHYYVYNSLLVFMPASNNQKELLKKLSSDLKIMDGQQSSHIVDPTALNGTRLVISDGGSVEKVIGPGNAEAHCTHCWINLKVLPDPSLWEDALLNVLRARGVDPESCYFLEKQDNLLNGDFFLWKTVLTLQEFQWTALQFEPEVEETIRFTSIIEKDVIQLAKFHIKIPKNPIESVTIKVQHRAGHVCDAIVAEEWVKTFPLTRSKCQVDLTNDDTMSFCVFGIDVMLPLQYIERTIQDHSSEHFYVDSITANYKTERKWHFDSGYIQNSISDVLRAGMDPAYNFFIDIDTEQSGTYIFGTIKTAPAQRNDMESRIKSLEYGGEKFHCNTFFVNEIQVQNCIFTAIGPELKSLVKQCPGLYDKKSLLVTDYVSLQLTVDMEQLMHSKYDETVGKVNRLLEGNELIVNDQSVLCSREGIKMLSATCDTYSTAVKICERSVVVYGSDADAAVDDIKRYQSKNSEGNWKILYLKDIEPSMKTATKMSIILKTWVKLEKRRNFTDMICNYDYFNIVPGITNVYIDLKSSTIKYLGSDSAADKLHSLLLQKLSEYLQMIESPLNTEIALPIECVSCFMPIMTSLYHNLYKCGHLYCHECFLLQMDVASQSKSFPLACAAAECNSNLSWLDVKDLYRGDEKGQQQIINSALANFIATKSSHGFFCTQPDCPGLLLRGNVDTTTSEKTACQNCGTCYCIMCKVSYHEGESCNEYRKNRITIEHHLQEWIDEKKDSRKLCPHCDSGIEKNGGCMKVYCINCRVHICWSCLDYFTEPTEAYLHLRQKHGTVY